jgi:prefoldin subunit 5
MPEKQVKLSENQLIQMAQQEEQNLENKRETLERLSTLLRETIISKETLKELKEHKGKIMVSIGATILIEAEITNTERCKRGFSDRAYKEETITETIKWLEEREDKMKNQIETLSKEYAKTQQKYTSLIGILKQIEADKQKRREKIKQGPPLISK